MATEHIRVVARLRPALFREEGVEEVVEVAKDAVFVDHSGTSRKSYRFGFDRAFPPSAKQEQVYDFFRPLIRSVCGGFNSTIFAYGREWEEERDAATLDGLLPCFRF